MAEPLTFGVAFSAGLVSFLSPCVLPLFPSYVSFVTGMSVDRLSAELQIAERVRVLLHSLAFIAGFTIIFVSLGASFSAAGQFLLDYRDWIRIAGGVLIALFGLYIAGLLKWGVLDRTRQVDSSRGIGRSSRSWSGRRGFCSWWSAFSSPPTTTSS